jgi:Zn-dependent peptidase ImmA (M78 family)
MLRIPASVTLPFGYRVTVKQSSTIPHDCDGTWDSDTRTITIRKSLPLKRRVYILGHELGHAWLDWQHEYLDRDEAKP